MSAQGVLESTQRAQLIARYKKLRKVSRNLNRKLVGSLSKEILYEGGKKLGMLESGTLVFNTEDESAVLMDYCIHDVRRKDRNAVESLLVESPPDSESVETEVLRAMQQATYSLFLVESVEPGLGVGVRDLRSNETLLIVDMGFGLSAQAGLVLASRLLRFEGFSMTGGAALPIGVLPSDERDSTMRELLRGFPVTGSDYFDPAPLIEACLEMDCSSHVRYEDPSGAPQSRAPQREPTRSVKPGRNDPCPCGSGKKYKKCCL